MPLARRNGAAALDGTVESEDSAAAMPSLTETLEQLSDADAPAPIQPFGGGVGASTHITSTTSQGAASLSYGTTLATEGRQGSGRLDGAPLSPVVHGGSGPALPQSQSRLGRSGSMNGHQRSGGGTALSGASLLFHSCHLCSVFAECNPAHLFSMLVVEWRMPGLPRPGSMLGGMVGVKVAIQKTSTEQTSSPILGVDDDDEASNSLVRAGLRSVSKCLSTVCGLCNTFAVLWLILFWCMQWLPLTRTLSGGSSNEPRSHTVYHLRVQHTEAGWGGFLQKRFNDFVKLADGERGLRIDTTPRVHLPDLI
eukprot:COSAG02_NODE_3202_length_7181_cov_25.177210_5_plen_309_part_00